jgi:transcriptional regulator with PAS, ATPase and Fis domain
MKTSENIWQDGFPSNIIVCDKDGVIIYMNKQAQKAYAKDGGAKLIGKNLIDCHPEPSKTKVKELLQSGKPNSYTIEKNAIKKFIHQSPWFIDGELKGLVEFSIEIPFDMPHFKRS